MSPRIAAVLSALIALLTVAAVVPPTLWTADDVRVHDHKSRSSLGITASLPAERLEGGFECVGDDVETGTPGLAADLFECQGVELLAYVPTEELSGDTTLADANPLDTQESSDMWGWTDPETGEEYVIIGKTNGVAFFNITEPTAPVHVASVDNTAAVQLLWHDIKVYDNTAYIVSESNGHGMLSVDLTRLRGMDGAGSPAMLDPDFVYPLANAAHNLAVNTDTGFAYILGGNTGLAGQDQCRSGLHMVDLKTPVPTFAGCYLMDGGYGTAAAVVGLDSPTVAGVRTSAAYVHDAQCVLYAGPDEDYTGREICVTYAEDRIVIVDVTDKALPVTVASFSYPDATYTHQGWFTTDQRYLLANDELDEQDSSTTPETRTIIVDVADLDNPGEPMIFGHGYTSIDHNLYTTDEAVYQSHYAKGLRVSDLDRVGEGVLEEVAFFDVHPDDDDRGANAITDFFGTWSNYPYFESGTIAVSGYEGLWLVRLTDEATAALND